MSVQAKYGGFENAYYILPCEPGVFVASEMVYLEMSLRILYFPLMFYNRHIFGAFPLSIPMFELSP